jgi:hypothetical protein
MQASQMSDLQNAQNTANDQWLAYQTQARNLARQQEEEARGRAEAGRQEALAKVTPQAQAQTVTDESKRLNTLYNDPGPAAHNPDNPSSMLLSGEHTGNQTFMDSLTSQVNQATQSARGRISALATAGAYGGSFGGLGNTVNEAFTRGGNVINEAGAERRGDLAAFGVAQAVPPLHYVMSDQTSQLGGIAKALGGIAGTIGGNAAGGGWGGGDTTGVGSGGWGVAPG